MRPIYMDNHATTPPDPEVLEVFLQVSRDYPGNPASTDHLHGVKALQRLEDARAEVAEALGADPREVVFTSGSTESNNLAIRGVIASSGCDRSELVTSRAEHSSVQEVCAQAERRHGCRVRYVPVTATGAVAPEALSSAVTSHTALVSIAAANNEVGTVNDVAMLARVSHECGALFHCDATQAVSTQKLSFREGGLDLMSLSGHKIYAPRGTGALLVRKSGPRVHLKSVVFGGSQERGLRPGTVSVAGAAALAAALVKIGREREEENERLARLRDKLWEMFCDGISDCQQNGDPERRVPGNLSIYVPGVEAKALVAAVRDVVSISTGSACSTASSAPSQVLTAMGQSAQRAYETIRIGIGRFNTEEDIRTAGSAIIDKVKDLRRLASI